MIFGMLGSLLFSANALPAHAGPTHWNGNGHWYEAVLAPSGNISWTDAQAAASKAGGYLATITSAAENAFVFGLVANDNAFWPDGTWHGPWLGGYQDRHAPGYSEPAGGWRWVTGEPWSYANWSAGEPNDNFNFGFPLGEDRVQFGSGRSGGWNDAPNDILVTRSGRVSGYIVEFNAVPEPSGLVWVIVGAIGMAALARRR
jgi:hypothetical protein